MSTAQGMVLKLNAITQYIVQRFSATCKNSRNSFFCNILKNNVSLWRSEKGYVACPVLGIFLRSFNNIFKGFPENPKTRQLEFIKLNY